MCDTAKKTTKWFKNPPTPSSNSHREDASTQNGVKKGGGGDFFKGCMIFCVSHMYVCVCFKSSPVELTNVPRLINLFFLLNL